MSLDAAATALRRSLRRDKRRARAAAIAASSAFSPDRVTRFRCGEIGRSGSSTAAAVSALSSRVNATLMTFALCLRKGAEQFRLASPDAKPAMPRTGDGSTERRFRTRGSRLRTGGARTEARPSPGRCSARAGHRRAIVERLMKALLVVEDDSQTRDALPRALTTTVFEALRQFVGR